MSRFVVIDDTNPSIQYSGPWFKSEVDSNTQSELVPDTSVMGPPFQNTLHGVNATANFSFPFSGMSPFLYWNAFDPSHTLRLQDRRLLFTGRAIQQMLLGPKIQPGSALSTIPASVGILAPGTTKTTGSFVAPTLQILKMVNIYSP